MGEETKVEVDDFDSGEEILYFMAKKGVLDFYGGILREEGEW